MLASGNWSYSSSLYSLLYNFGTLLLISLLDQNVAAEYVVCVYI